MEHNFDIHIMEESLEDARIESIIIDLIVFTPL